MVKLTDDFNWYGLTGHIAFDEGKFWFLTGFTPIHIPKYAAILVEHLTVEQRREYHLIEKYVESGEIPMYKDKAARRDIYRKPKE